LRRRDGKASVDAFFTAKSESVYAIQPRWPGRQFILKEYTGAKPKSVTLLGFTAPLRFKSGTSTVTAELPELSGDLHAQAGWVLKFSR
jgi:hypothetical protein